ARCTARRALCPHCRSSTLPRATRDHVNARLGRRTASPSTATRGAPQLALLFDHFTARHSGPCQRSARPPDGLTSHCHTRRASARTAFRSFHRSPLGTMSTLGSAAGRPHLALPHAARLSSHCFSIISPLASARGAPQLALPSNTTLA